jgi:hypothetical protein
VVQRISVGTALGFPENELIAGILRQLFSVDTLSLNQGCLSVTKTKKQDCLDDYELEAYVQGNCDSVARQIGAIHISRCYRCFVRHFDVRMLHEILENELKKPVSEQVLNWVKEIQHH